MTDGSQAGERVRRREAGRKSVLVGTRQENGHRRKGVMEVNFG